MKRGQMQTERLKTILHAQYVNDADDTPEAIRIENALALSRCADALEAVAGCVLSGDGEKALAIFRKDEL